MQGGDCRGTRWLCPVKGRVLCHPSRDESEMCQTTMPNWVHVVEEPAQDAVGCAWDLSYDPSVKTQAKIALVKGSDHAVPKTGKRAAKRPRWDLVIIVGGILVNQHHEVPCHVQYEGVHASIQTATAGQLNLKGRGSVAGGGALTCALITIESPCTAIVVLLLFSLV